MLNSSALIALHGNLGLPRDWEGVRQSLSNEHSEAMVAVDLWRAEYLSDLGLLAREIAQSTQNDRRILLGYSMGGRLVIELLKRHPKLAQCAVLISVNPGIEDPDARQARILRDREWGEKFADLNSSWNSIIEEWNSQGVFKNSLNPQRLESDFSRSLIASAFSEWSVGKLPSAWEWLAQPTIPILWIVGANDSAAIANTKRVASLNNPLIQIAVIEGAGHRVLEDQSQRVAERIDQFLGESDASRELQ